MSIKSLQGRRTAYAENQTNVNVFERNWIILGLLCKQAYRVVHQPVSRGFAVFADAWLSGWLAEISADLRETVAH